MFDAEQPKPNAQDHVQFYMGSIQNDEKSKDAGRPVFDEVEFIKIMIPGDKSNVIERPVNDIYRERYGRQYQAFKAGNQEAGLSGTTLSAWPLLTRSQALELNYFNVRTVEQLASMGDEVAQKFPGSVSLRQKARDYVEQAKGNAPLLKMREELEKRDNEIATLKMQLKEVVDGLAEQRKASKGGK